MDLKFMFVARRIAQKIRDFAPSMSFIGSYLLWIWVFQMVVLTLVTYFLRASGSTLAEISDVFSANEIPIAGISALVFVASFRILSPTSRGRFGVILGKTNLVDDFLPSLIRGGLVAIGIVSAFYLSGYYNYLDVFIHFDGTILPVVSVGFRVLSIFLLVYFEEYIFRKRLLNQLKERSGAITAVVVSAVFYCVAKNIQFRLGIMHTGTLFLVSVALGLAVINEGRFARGAGLLAGLLIFFHPLFGLPILGNAFNGLLLIQYQAQAESIDLLSAFSQGTDSRTALFLTGGIGGPLSSFSLQIMILLLVLVRLSRYRLKTKGAN